jgi:hypothetical protein
MSRMDRKQMANTNPTHAWAGLTPVRYWIILNNFWSFRLLSMLVNMVRTKEVIYLVVIFLLFFVIEL